MVSAYLQVATEAKISDLLLGKPEGLHVNDLAERSGLNAKKLVQVLRLLATNHIYQEGWFESSEIRYHHDFILKHSTSSTIRLRQQSFEHQATLSRSSVEFSGYRVS